MISERLKNLIIPYLKMDLPSIYHSRIDSLFEETYLMKDEQGVDVVCIRSPIADYMCFTYYALNGAGANVELWEVVKKNGKKL